MKKIVFLQSQKLGIFVLEIKRLNKIKKYADNTAISKKRKKETDFAK